MDRGEEKPPEPPKGAKGVGGGPGIDADEILHQVAQQRCMRLKGCGDVGASKRYANDPACVNAMHQQYATIGERCMHGLDRRRLAGCVNAIDQASCEDLRETARLDACRVETLCPGE